ncbi:MAG: Acyltransferase family protein [Rhodospirillales bacterium]|jgi:peptidoglycan/LPS O-acetylase OafA/YrhL|nr:Acyltransferase family protein [Rhodospirillales bacterium]
MAQAPQLNSAQRVFLDFVRGGAAVLVLLGHSAHYFWKDSLLASGTAQALGVFVFFLISGFLISLSVFQKHSDRGYRFTEYFIDRFCRIYCVLLPALIFVAVLDGMVRGAPEYEWHRDYNLQTWIANLFMLQDFPLFQTLRRLGFHDNPWFVSEFGSARPFWTISIEWWIYMLFGAVVLRWLRDGHKLGALAILVLALVAIEPIYYFVGGYDQCLGLLWLTGMAASILYLRLPQITEQWPQFDDARWLRIFLVIAGGALVAMAGRLFANHAEVSELQFGLFLGIFIFGLLFACSASRFTVPKSIERGVGFVAGYSYSLYLTHHTILEFLSVRLSGEVANAALFWMAIVMSNVVAIGFWYLFERHHRQMARFLKVLLAKRRRVEGGVLA